MTGFIVNFVTLFFLLHFFERDREEVDLPRIAIVAVVPALVVLILAVVAGLFVSPYIFNFTVTTVVLAIVTFALLRKVLAVPARRSLWYAVAIVSVNTLVETYVS